MTAERYHENKATSFERSLAATTVSLALLVLMIGIGVQFGYIQFVADGFAFHWQTIWQVLVLAFLLSLVNK